MSHGNNNGIVMLFMAMVLVISANIIGMNVSRPIKTNSLLGYLA